LKNWELSGDRVKYPGDSLVEIAEKYGMEVR